MRILAHVHKYPPVHNAGAEWMLHAILTWLRDERGAELRVIAAHIDRPFEFEDVPVQTRKYVADLHEEYRWADIVVTHLDETRMAIKYAGRFRKPLVHLVHNDRQLSANGVYPPRTALVVFNSEWIRIQNNYPGRHMIVHPPVSPARYRVDNTGAHLIVMSNLMAAKGADLFYQVAERCPDFEFVGIRGAYGHQIERDLPNVSIVDPVQDIRRVFERTRLVLMPSTYESWGRMAVEAACSGIPTIASATPGLVEALGEAGIVLETRDPGLWARWVTDLMTDETGYREVSNMYRDRADELAGISDFQLVDLAETMEEICADARV